MITDVDGVAVGHWTDDRARTGCTVVLLPDGTVASGEVRGGAPGTRDWELLSPERTVARLDAVVLSGGSAFGLATADGVMRWCEERGRGLSTVGGPIPIVVGAVVFDLAVGDGSVRPGPAEGYAACEVATTDAPAVGPVGAGCGATYDKWRGFERRRAGGLGSASRRQGDLVVGALVVLNAFGGIRGDDRVAPEPDGMDTAAAFENTTIGVIATNARLDKGQCLLVAQSGHDGLARALEPVHTTVDGDALVAAATHVVDADLETVRMLAARAVDDAVRRSVP